ncbi:hypothetical protein CYLTODRAFT_382402 [Cylindrobasidium torrendii FP15055 ss-10]|uniref:Yeast cell wall synthesis Kre9/Knh1-like N-terminal domain-containing protein n=1 Tax=Cylindrobasidium torrendii FP15055 ss-10 TaxID=1314674 RepID=A0A0D7AYA9_9AGAR|nr:hypothetical protein CYLTODRAFT_382402 [Cylindrobasidium torrendii FP15055 ss-10]
MMYTVLAAAAPMLFSLASATPVGPLDIWTPTITNPTAATVWTVGQTVEVTWATDDAPENVSNGGEVVLGKGTNFLYNVIVDHFDLKAANGAITVTVPEVEAGDDYFVVLFGDSGNASDKFTIQA